MSQVSEVFDQALNMESGKYILLPVSSKEHLHSLRVMLYRESARFEEKLGFPCCLSYSKEKIKGDLFLCIKHNTLRKPIVMEEE